MSEMVYVSLRTDKPGTVNSFTVMMKANSRPAPVLRLVPDRDSRNNSVRPTARLRAVSDFQFSIRDRPCRHPSRLSVSRWNRGFECRASRIAVRHVFPAAMNNGGGIWLSGCCRWKKSAGRRNKFLATFHNSFDLMLFNTRHTVMPESFILFLSR